MTEIPERWILNRYSQLWNRKETKSFTLKEASEILSESPMVTAVILSRLRKSGWINAEIDDIDYRRKRYRCNNPKEVIAIIGE